jgi:hypothetical protein
MTPSKHDRLAFDKGSVRRIDQDGRLHVEVANISKATVNPYQGSEIPDSESLGLDPKQIYQLLRDPDELEKAAPTFNNIPLLSEHIPVSADDHQPDLVVGSTGSNAVFAAPYLQNSLVVWAGDAIDGIQNETQRELSCAYRYTAVMEPGTYEGVHFDGRMTNIIGNHVAVVPIGRAGPDVVIGDSKPLEFQTMTIKKPLSRKAALVKGALLALKPKLAADAKLNLNPILAGVTAANWLTSKPLIAAAIKPKLANDADLADIVELLDSLGDPDDNVGLDDDMPADPGAGAVDASPVDDILASLKGKISDEDMKDVEGKLRGLKLAGDEDDDKKDPPDDKKPALDAPPPTPGTPAPPATAKKDDDSVSKPAMDAAIKSAVKTAEAAAVKRMRDIAHAEVAVQPWVGKLAIAADSAEFVYKTALETMGIDVSDIHPSAFRAVLEAQPKPGTTPVRIAADSARPQGFAERFPNAAVRKV